jgi:hypothetical protein
MNSTPSPSPKMPELENLEYKIGKNKKYIVTVENPHFPRIKEFKYLFDLSSSYNIIIGNLYISELVKEKIPFWRKNIKNIFKEEKVERKKEILHIDDVCLTFPTIEIFIKHINKILKIENGNSIKPTFAKTLLSKAYRLYISKSKEYKKNIEELSKEYDITDYPLLLLEKE